MQSINISEARNKLPELIERIKASRQSVTLMRYGKPAAVLSPVNDVVDSNNPYPLRGTSIKMSDDFNAPLDSLWQTCEVAEQGKKY